MTKDDKAKIAEAWRSYNLAATRCSNVLYNLAQTKHGTKEVENYSELVRHHDAARNSLARTLERFGLIKKAL